MKEVVVLSEARRKYLFNRGILPIEGFIDFYEKTEQFKQAMKDYDIFIAGFRR